MVDFQSLIPKTYPTIIFLSITFIEMIVDSSIVAVLLNTYLKNTSVLSAVNARDEGSVLPVYLGLFVLAHLFQFILALDALANKNMIMIFSLLAFNTLFFIYSIIQITEINAASLVTGNALHIVIWFIPGMIAVTELVYLSTVWSIYQSFGWIIYKKIGADRGVKKMYLWYQVFICILKFDYFFFLSFSLQLVFLVLDQSRLERYLTSGALPITLIILLIGYYSVKNEIKSLCLVFLVGCLLGSGYFIFKLFRVYQFRSTDYRLAYKSLTVFAALSLTALLWTSTTAFICYRNFNAGLKYAMMKSGKDSSQIHSSGGGHYKMEEANSSRMSMD